MSSIIEQATKRLEQLKRAGVALPNAGLELKPSAREPDGMIGTGQGETRTGREDHLRPVPSLRQLTIDLDALCASGFVTPSAPRSPLQDQYRALKRPLIHNATGQGASSLPCGKLIMVTSALPGEGKTFTSINLAMSIAAELDYTVMLVDADVEKPSVCRTLCIDNQSSVHDGQGMVGLLDVLDGKAVLSDVLLGTNVERLTLLPSGSYHPHATELLASDAMHMLLDEMATKYPDRIVVFDSPPLLPTTEAAVLASHMGQIVVVVQADKTLRRAVEGALAKIESCPVRMLLLNQSRGAADAAFGGYGYGYHYPGERSKVATGGQNIGSSKVMVA